MSDKEDKPNIDSEEIAADDGAIARIVQENEDDAERKARAQFGDIGGNVSSAMNSSADTKHKDSSASIPVLPQIYVMAPPKQILDSTSSTLRNIDSLRHTKSSCMDNMLKPYIVADNNNNKHKTSLVKRSRAAYLEEIKKHYEGNKCVADLLWNCMESAMAGMSSATHDFFNIHNVVDEKVALLSEGEKSVAEKYGTRNDGSHAIDPDTYQVNVGGKVMLLKELFGSPNDSFSSNFIGRTYFTFLLPRRYGSILDKDADGNTFIDMNSQLLEKVFRDIKDVVVVSNKAQTKSRKKKSISGAEDTTSEVKPPKTKKRRTNKTVTSTQGQTLGDWSNEFADSYRCIFGKNLLIPKETKPTEAKFITHPFTPPTHTKIESLLKNSNVLQGADFDEFKNVITKKIHSFGNTFTQMKLLTKLEMTDSGIMTDCESVPAIDRLNIRGRQNVLMLMSTFNKNNNNQKEHHAVFISPEVPSPKSELPFLLDGEKAIPDDKCEYIMSDDYERPNFIIVKQQRGNEDNIVTFDCTENRRKFAVHVPTKKDVCVSLGTGEWYITQHTSKNVQNGFYFSITHSLFVKKDAKTGTPDQNKLHSYRTSTPEDMNTIAIEDKDRKTTITSCEVYQIITDKHMESLVSLHNKVYIDDAIKAKCNIELADNFNIGKIQPELVKASKSNSITLFGSKLIEYQDRLNNVVEKHNDVCESFIHEYALANYCSFSSSTIVKIVVSNTKEVYTRVETIDSMPNNILSRALIRKKSSHYEDEDDKINVVKPITEETPYHVYKQLQDYVEKGGDDIKISEIGMKNIENDVQQLFHLLKEYNENKLYMIMYKNGNYYGSDDGKVVQKFLKHIYSERGYTTLDITKLKFDATEFDIALETLRLKRMYDCGLIDHHKWQYIIGISIVKSALNKLGIVSTLTEV